MHFEVNEEAYLDAAEQHARELLTEISRDAAAEARSSHSFKNKTGRLEGSIRPITTTGHFFSGNLSAGIEAEAEYAGFVEYGTRSMKARPFLEPAVNRALRARNLFEPRGYF